MISSGETVSVEANGRKVYSLSLLEDRVVEVQGARGITRVEIRKGRVRVIDSDCPRKICVQQGWIQRGSIICLPNRVVVSIEGGAEGGVDAITG